MCGDKNFIKISVNIVEIRFLWKCTKLKTIGNEKLGWGLVNYWKCCLLKYFYQKKIKIKPVWMPRLRNSFAKNNYLSKQKFSYYFYLLTNRNEIKQTSNLGAWH